MAFADELLAKVEAAKVAQGFAPEPAAPAPVNPQTGFAMPEALPPEGGGIPQAGNVQMPVGAPNPHAMTPEQLQDPEWARAARNLDLANKGLEWKHRATQQQRDASWVPQSRTGAIEDINAPEREHIAARKRGLARDQRDISYDENERMRQYAHAREVEAQEEVLKKEHRMATIDSEVSFQKREMDQLLGEQRALIDKGISPWEAYGSGSKAQGQMSAALTMASAGFVGLEEKAQAAAMINGIIDRDVRNQMFALDTKGGQVESAYGRLLDKYDDRDQAEAALRILMQDAAKAELESMILQSADPNAALAAEQLIVSIEESLLAEHETFRQRAIGKQTDVYDQGQEFVRGGSWIGEMGNAKWNKHKGSVAGVMSKQADTVGEHQRQQIAGQKAVSFEQGAPAGLNGKQAITKALASRHKSAGQMDRLFKLMGAKGRDPETGQPIGEFSKDIPGKGMLGHPFAGLQAALGNTEGEDLQDLNAAIGDQLLRDASGAQSNESETKKFGKLYGESTWTEAAFKKKVLAASTMLADGTKGFYAGLDKESVEFLRRRAKEESPELYDQALPGQFEDNAR